MTPDEWFEHLRDALPPADGGSAPAELGEEEVTALLELARIAAHTGERWTAPVSTFVLGLAGAGLTPAERSRWLWELVERLEPGP